jgi:hypothetical protein
MGSVAVGLFVSGWTGGAFQRLKPDRSETPEGTPRAGCGVPETRSPVISYEAHPNRRAFVRVQ